MKKYLFLSVILLSLIISAFEFKPATSDDWEKVNSFKGVDIFQKKAVKRGKDFAHEYILFRYENTTSQVVEISWKLNIWYGENCRSCKLPSPGEYDLNLNLKPGETITGTTDDTDKRLRLYSCNLKKDSSSKLTKIEFKNIR